MSELSTAELSKFEEAIAPLGEAFAMSLSENINQLAVFDAAIVTQESIGALITDPEPLLQTSFSFPTVCEDDAAILFREQDACVLADLIGLGDGTDPPKMLEEAHLENLSNAMAGFVQGIGVAIGNAIDKLVAPGPACSTQLVPLTLSSGFLTAGYAVQLAYPFRVDGALDTTLRILITPNLARSIAQLPMVDDEIGGLGADVFGASGSPAPATPMFDSPPSAAMPFQPFQPMGGPVETMPRGMDLILDIPLDVSVELGRVQMLIKDVLELATGSIVELERVAGEPIDLMVNGQLIAKGEVVVIEDNFGIRITEIVSPADRLTSVGKRAA